MISQTRQVWNDNLQPMSPTCDTHINAFGDTHINAFGDTHINEFGDTHINAFGDTHINAFGVWGGGQRLTHI